DRGACAGSSCLADFESATSYRSGLADDTPGSLEGVRSYRRPGGTFEATDRDFEAGDAFVAALRGRAAAAYGADKGDQFGAQGLVMADRQMAHRIAAVRLEAEALGHLTGEQIAHHIFAARRHGDAARLERRQPVGVDMGKHARGRPELQQRDILALGDRTGKLWLHFDDVGF